VSASKASGPSGTQILLEAAWPRLDALWRASCDADTPLERTIVFLSLSDGTARAQTLIAQGRDLAEAWAVAASDAAALAWQGVGPAWLRAEFVRRITGQSWAALQRRFAATKRNYFREGISFRHDFSQAILPQELGANALLYDNRIATCSPNPGNLAAFGKRRFGQALNWPRSADEIVWTFMTRGVFVDAEGVHTIEHEGRNQGYRQLPDWSAERVLDVVDRATAYLAAQVQSSGAYHYGWFPCFDREIPTYNALRHASSTYALLEGWEASGNAAARNAAERALDYLCQNLVRVARLPSGREAAFLVDVGQEIKLGGNAVSILALAKHAELTGRLDRLPLMVQLAEGIVHMQEPDGSFVHVLEFPSLVVKQRERIIYYDGEAAFGLMRLYSLNGEARWLDAVERAFDYFIRADHWRAHDHWLSYCVNELTAHRPLERYFRFGLDNVRGHLDFVLHRITTYPTLLELMMAAQAMIMRIEADARHRHLLDGFDRAKFARAMHARARYLMSGFFWPEVAMFFANPGRILHGFFIRHHSYRVRIDDVEHYLSGYVAYWKHLCAPAPALEAAIPALPCFPSAEGEMGGDERIVFLHDDLRQVGNGVEMAGIRRAALLHGELGLTPWILTAAWSPGLRRTEAELKRSGALPPAVRVLNVHDWIATMATDGRLLALPEAWGVPEQATRSRSGAMVRACWETLEAGDRLRREEYGLADGTPVMRKEYVHGAAGWTLRRILLQPAGQPPARFTDQGALVHALMLANLSTKTFWHLVIDRNRTYRGILEHRLRENLACSMTTVFHSTHLRADGSRKRAYRFVLEHPATVDELVVLTQEQRQDLLAEGFPADRLHVVGHWLHPFPEVAPDRIPAAPRVVYLARYAPEKGHAGLFRAFSEVARAIPDATLETYGVGPLKASLSAWVRDAGLSDRIRINGLIRDVGEAYRGASLAVLPSHEEGFALSGLEALAHGCPLVAFAVRYGPRDLLATGEGGVLVASGDEVALAQAIIRLLSAPERLLQMRCAARAAAARFDAGAAVERWGGWWSRVQSMSARATGGGRLLCSVRPPRHNYVGD